MESQVKRLTPSELAESFSLLSEDERKAFLHAIASNLKAAEAALLLERLPDKEKVWLDRLMLLHGFAVIWPTVVTLAWEAIQKTPSMTSDEVRSHVFASKLFSGMRDLFEWQFQEIDEIAEARLKQQRDRSTPESTIRVYVELCQLRRSDPAEWNFKKLARKYEISAKWARQVVKDEEK